MSDEADFDFLRSRTLIMRIALVNYRYFISGGPERYLFNIKEILERNGHEVIPFSIKGP